MCSKFWGNFEDNLGIHGEIPHTRYKSMGSKEPIIKNLPGLAMYVWILSANLMDFNIDFFKKIAVLPSNVTGTLSALHMKYQNPKNH